MHQEEPWQKVVKFGVIFFSIIAGVTVLQTLDGIFLPLVVALFIAYLFAPAVEFFARFKIPRIVTLFILLMVVTIAGNLIAQLIFSNIREFVNFWPDVENQLIQDIEGFLKKYFKMDMGYFFSILKELDITLIFSSVLNISISFIGKLFTTLLILIFIYLAYHNYPKVVEKAFKEKDVQKIFSVWRSINTQIINYVLIKTLISSGTGLLTAVACGIIGIKFALLWGFLAFILNYIPYIGSVIAVIFPIAISLLQFPHSYMPLIAGFFLILIQVFMGSYLDPEIMGNKFNLSPLVIIFSLFFWGYVWGMVGAFLAVPITAIVKIVLLNIESTKRAAVLMSKRVG